MLQTLSVGPGLQEAPSDANVLPAAGPGGPEGRGAPRAGGRAGSRQDFPAEDPGDPVCAPRAAPKHPSHAEGVPSEAAPVVSETSGLFPCSVF